jgi:hypothetical protein
VDIIDRKGRLVTRYTADAFDAEAAAAMDLLLSLEHCEDGRKPPKGEKYDRAALKLSWTKLKRLGMDVKDAKLGRAMDAESVVFDSDGYTVRSGWMTDPYTGERIVFEQLPKVARRLVELDHVVPLSDAFVSGGHRWKRAGGYSWPDLYNDPGNLIATSAYLNQSKGGRNAAGWLPRLEFCVRYVIMQIVIKDRYCLSVTRSESDNMQKVLRGQWDEVVNVLGRPDVAGPAS